MASSLLGFLLDHLAPGCLQSLGQSGTDAREPGNVNRRPEITNRTIVGGQRGGREDLYKETWRLTSDLLDALTCDVKKTTKMLTVLSSADFWARVNPSKILPKYAASLLMSGNRKKKMQNR